MKTKKFTTDFAGTPLTFEIGKLAEQANGAVLAQWGDTVILATCVMSDKNREGVDFFPLSVDFEERYYAAGFIKQSRFMKREGRPTDQAVLAGRMIDRSLRPRFNQSLRREIQVIVTALSVGDKNNLDILGLNAASLALLISDIPWDGPVGALRAGYDNAKRTWSFCPSNKEQKENDGNLIIAGTEDKINMIESEGSEIGEDQILKGTEKILPEIQKLMKFQQEIAKEIGIAKKTDLVEQINPEISKLVKEFLDGKIKDSLFAKGKGVDKLEELKESLFEAVNSRATELEIDKIKAQGDALYIFEEELNDFVHIQALKNNKRVDGRSFDEIREITCEIDTLPRTHGSAIFKRGKTQALSVVTLGSPRDEQLLDGMETVDEKRHYFHHYNFLPFSTGEVKRLGGTNRREIGHGYIAEKALLPVLPSKDEFPYTMRVVSEIMSSNGSSSMASTCGSTLSLMAAGVPIKKPVAGIALGLMIDNDKYKVLTDIQGPEDHYGDMDLKVAGTKDGITVIQMDVKIDGINQKMFEEGLKAAKKARLFLLEKITATIAQPKKELSPWAPRIYTMQINPDKIKDVIGSGGKIINNIIDKTGVNMDIEDSGRVVITSKDEASAQKALKWVDDLTREVQVGEVFEGKVVKIMDFGAFTQILPGKDGLIHISELADHRVEKVEDVVKEGDIVTVKVKEVDRQGKISLTLKDAKKDSPQKESHKK